MLSRLVDYFMFDIPVKSMALSPTGMFLATAHVGDLGVYLWSNMTMFGSAVLTPLPADYEPSLIELPSTDDRTKGSQVFTLGFYGVYRLVYRSEFSRIIKKKSIGLSVSFHPC